MLKPCFVYRLLPVVIERLFVVDLYDVGSGEGPWKVTWARVKITFRLTVYIAVDSSIKGQNLESNHCLWLNWFWNVNVLGHNSITKLINKNFQNFLKFWCKFKRPKKERERKRKREREGSGLNKFLWFFWLAEIKIPWAGAGV